MSGQEIKNLRLRLGWTHSDLARRLACCPTEVQRWEDGASLPSREALNHMQYLSFQAESLAETLAAKPLVERAMNSFRLEQISAEEWRRLADGSGEA